MENLKSEMVKDAEDIISQIDAFRKKAMTNLATDSNQEGLLRLNEKQYMRTFVHDLDAVKNSLDKDVAFWRKRMDQA